MKQYKDQDTFRECQLYKGPNNVKAEKNSIRDARTSQPGKIVFNTMTYRSSETVQRPEYFQCSVTCIKVQIMFK